MIEIKPEVRPIETVTPIKPSEAIRLGCLLYPRKTDGDTIQGDSACAMGAMLAGFGFDDRGDASAWCDSRVLGRLQIETGGCPDNPECHWNKPKPSGVVLHAAWGVVHLNDQHNWSRERIADWLESLGL